MNKHRFLKACMCVLLAGCAAEKEDNSELVKYSNLSYDAGFDTVYAYTEFGTDEEKMKQNFTRGAELFRKCNDLFDIYHTYDGVNNLMTINENAGIRPVETDPAVIDMLKQAKEFYDLSGGAFDITIGSVLQVWHRYREAGIEANKEGKTYAVPSDEELREAASHSGWSHVIIDEEKNTVYLDDPEMSLDVGGIAKGYAAEYIARDIEPRIEGYANVNAGRNIRTIHEKADGTDWRIGVVDPEDGSSLLVIAMPGSQSFVTSGDYERFYIGDDGNRYHHICDPATLKPASYYRSVTIATRNSSAADCLSTALFCLSVEEGKEVLRRYTEKTGEKADAVWIMAADKAQDVTGRETGDYFVAYTDGLEGVISWK